MKTSKWLAVTVAAALGAGGLMVLKTQAIERGAGPRHFGGHLLEQAKNGIVADEVRSVETLLGKADRINGYMTFRGRPDLFNEELQRYRDVTIEDVRRVAQTYLTRPRVVLSIVPKGKRELAAAAAAP